MINGTHNLRKRQIHEEKEEPGFDNIVIIYELYMSHRSQDLDEWLYFKN